MRSLVTGTQWRIGSHDASTGGTNLLKSFFGTSRFTFPKSIYAVHDTIRFFLANKPNALVVDFLRDLERRFMLSICLMRLMMEIEDAF